MPRSGAAGCRASSSKALRGPLIARRRLLFETLEDRVTPATISWTGNGLNSNWANPANWNLGRAPRGRRPHLRHACRPGQPDHDRQPERPSGLQLDHHRRLGLHHQQFPRSALGPGAPSTPARTRTLTISIDMPSCRRGIAAADLHGEHRHQLVLSGHLAGNPNPSQAGSRPSPRPAPVPSEPDQRQQRLHRLHTLFGGRRHRRLSPQRAWPGHGCSRNAHCRHRHGQPQLPAPAPTSAARSTPA